MDELWESFFRKVKTGTKPVFYCFNIDKECKII